MLKDKDAKQLKIIDFGTAQDLTITPNAKAMAREVSMVKQLY